MKKSINGKIYNTETAQEIASNWNGYPVNDFHYVNEKLYRTAKGAWFIHGKGGALSAYSQQCGDGRGGSEDIQPLLDCEAMWLLEKWEEIEALEKFFSDSLEEA